MGIHLRSTRKKAQAFPKEENGGKSFDARQKLHLTSKENRVH